MNFTSLNESERKKFETMSKEWLDPNGPFKALHAIIPLRIQWLSSLTQLSNITVLDVGCGGGLMSSALAKLGAKVTAIDTDLQAINLAKNYSNTHNLAIDYQHTTLESFRVNNPNQQYDLVIAFEIVEHVDNLNFFLSQLVASVKPEGLLAFSTLNKNLKSLILAKWLAEYVLFWVKPKTHSWRKFIPPQQLDFNLNRLGFKPHHKQGMSYEMKSGNWVLSNDLSVNYFASYKAS